MSPKEALLDLNFECFERRRSGNHVTDHTATFCLGLLALWARGSSAGRIPGTAGAPGGPGGAVAPGLPLPPARTEGQRVRKRTASRHQPQQSPRSKKETEEKQKTAQKERSTVEKRGCTFKTNVKKRKDKEQTTVDCNKKGGRQTKEWHRNFHANTLQHKDVVLCACAE